MLSLRFYGGHYEIGGTKPLLRTDEGQVFLEFGKSFETEGRFFEEPWNPPFHIASLLSVGALPDLPGLYRTGGAAPPVNGIIISHAHQDHGGCVPFLEPGIPPCRRPRGCWWRRPANGSGTRVISECTGVARR